MSDLYSVSEADVAPVAPLPSVDATAPDAADDVVVTLTDATGISVVVSPTPSFAERAKLRFKEYRLKELPVEELRELAECINRYVTEQTDPNKKKEKELMRNLCAARKDDDDKYLAALAEYNDFRDKLIESRIEKKLEAKKTKTSEKVAHQRVEGGEVVEYAGKGVCIRLEEWLEMDGWVKGQKTTSAMKSKRAELIKQYQDNAKKWSGK